MCFVAGIVKPKQGLGIYKKRVDKDYISKKYSCNKFKKKNNILMNDKLLLNNTPM